MTVSSSTDRETFPGNGTTTVFPLPFRFFKNSDITAYLIDDVSGVITPLVLGTNYSLFGAGEPEEDGNPVSSITMFVAPITGSSLFVQRVMEITQPTEVINQSRFFPETHETVFDRITMLIQQVFGRISRALRVPDSDPEPGLLPPASVRAGQILGFDANGDPIVVAPASGSATDLAIRLANQIDPSLGLNMIGYRGRTAAEAFQGIGVSPEDYGAKNDFGAVTDSSLAIAAAIAAAKSLKRPIIWSGNYGASQVVGDAVNGVTIIAGGTLTGLSSTALESVLTLKNFADFRLYGRLVVSAGYKTTYACGVAIYTDTGAGASQYDISGLVVVGAQVGVRVGRRSEPDALLSECNFFGGNFYGCPTCYEVIGTQTVVNFIGCNMITGVNGAPAGVAAAWAALPRTAVRSFGASYTTIGGEALIVDVTGGLLYDNQPIASTLVGNRYGTASINNTTIESASQVCFFRNPEGIPSLVPGTGSIRMVNCDGFHSQNSVFLIQTFDDFSGTITAIANPIFCNIARTVDNISVGAAACDIFVDDNSFGRNFKKGVSAVAGGRVHFTYRKIFEVQNFANQSLPVGLTDLKPTTLIQTGDLARPFASYNAATGVITTLQSLRSLTIKYQYQTAGLTAGDTYIVIGSTNTGIVANNRLVQGELTLNEVPAGTTIKVQVNNTGISGQSALAGAAGFIQLLATNI